MGTQVLIISANMIQSQHTVWRKKNIIDKVERSFCSSGIGNKEEASKKRQWASSTFSLFLTLFFLSPSLSFSLSSPLFLLSLLNGQFAEYIHCMPEHLRVLWVKRDEKRQTSESRGRKGEGEGRERGEGEGREGTGRFSSIREEGNQWWDC